MKRILTAVLVLGVLLTGSLALAANWLTGTTEEKFNTLSKLQLALGTVMIEYSSRFTTMFYAARGGNWDLAAYELKEAREIQEVGETTRPQFATGLKGLESTALVPLEESIKTKDFSKFLKAFVTAEQGCNACHAAQGFPFIHYVLPPAPPSPLLMAPLP